MRTLLFVLVLLVAACGPATQPKTGPGTEWPCGTQGLVCSNKMCCGEGDVCGGDDKSCPKDMCCFAGPQEGDALGAARRVHQAQWAPKSVN